jgi:outer membrane beta-barrel protein
MTLRRHAIQALALAAVIAAAALPSAAFASKADAFEGKIQPVSGQLYRKAGRVELTLGGDLSLNDAFFQKRFGDVKLGWHFTESLALTAHAALGAAVPTNSTTVCPTGEACRPASDAQLQQVPGRIRSLVGLEVAWAPIYGKLNTFSEKVAHIDLALLVGADFILHDEVLSTDAALSGVDPAVLRTPGFHVGVGARVFFAEAFAVKVDIKDYVYGVEVPNGEEGTTGKDMQNQIFAELGISVFFPFTNRRQP